MSNVTLGCSTTCQLSYCVKCSPGYDQNWSTVTLSKTLESVTTLYGLTMSTTIMGRGLTFNFYCVLVMPLSCSWEWYQDSPLCFKTVLYPFDADNPTWEEYGTRCFASTEKNLWFCQMVESAAHSTSSSFSPLGWMRIPTHCTVKKNVLFDQLVQRSERFSKKKTKMANVWLHMSSVPSFVKMCKLKTYCYVSPEK